MRHPMKSALVSVALAVLGLIGANAQAQSLWVAFEANTSNLWLYSSASGNAGPVSGGLGMQPGTSPSIAALSNGSYEVAFQANTGSARCRFGDRDSRRE